MSGYAVAQAFGSEGRMEVVAQHADDERAERAADKPGRREQSR